MRNKYHLTLVTLSKSQGGANIAGERIRLNLQRKFKIQAMYSKNINFLQNFKYYFARVLIKLFIKNELLLNSPNLFSKINLNNANGQIIFLNWIGEETISIDNMIFNKKPIIWIAHDLWPFTSTEHFLENPNKKSYSSKDAYKNFFKKIIFKKKKLLFKKKNILLITNSKWLENFSKKSSLTKNTRVKTIYNPIETDIWVRKNKELSKKKLNLNVKKKYILVGAHGGLKNYRKGGDLLIESLKYIKFLSDEYEFLILGSNLEKKEIINEFNFNFRKFTHDKLEQTYYHSASDFTISPSRGESIPQFIVETLLCENPVVSFDIGGMNEIINHKKNGYLAHPFNKKDLAKGIIYFTKNFNRLKMSKYRARIAKMFDQNRNLKEYVSIIDEILRS